MSKKILVISTSLRANKEHSALEKAREMGRRA